MPDAAISLSVLVYATQVVAGILVVHALRDEDPTSGWNRGPGRWARILLLGPGVITMQMLLYDAIGLSFGLFSILAPWWVLTVAHFFRRRPRVATPSLGWKHTALVGAVVLVVAVSYAGTGFTPIYHGDAIHNFTVIGKLFAQQHALAPRALAGILDVGHNEYPPLIALNEAILFMVDESVAPWAARPMFGLAHLALALLTVEALWSARLPRLSIFLCLLFIAAPQPCANTGIGTPDIRLTASVLLLGIQGLAMHRHRGRGLLRFAVVAGLCGFTKNEGIAISTIGFAYLIFHAVRTRVDWGSALSALVFIGALVATWPLFREAHGIREQFLGDAVGRSALANALDRTPTVIGYFASLTMGNLPEGAPRWGPLWVVALVLGVRAIAMRESRPQAIGMTLGLLAHLGLYTTTFALTPYNVEWHLATAADRLLMHTTGWLVLIMAAWLHAHPADRSPGCA